MQTDVSDELLQWIEQRETICFELPVDVDWETGEATKSSLAKALAEVMKPLFEAAGSARVIGGKFGASSFQGQGELALSLSVGTARDWAISYRPELTSMLSEFFVNPTQGRGAFDELRGALLFQFDPESRVVGGALKLVSAPHVVRNLGALFGASARNKIRAAVKAHPKSVIAAFSDRSSLRNVHFFGTHASLQNVIRRSSLNGM